MAVSLAYTSNVTSTEVITGNAVGVATDALKTITHGGATGFNKTATLTSATTPPVTKCAYFNKAMSGGAGTIDLTALSGTNGATVDGTGLKVQVIKFQSPAANGNTISVTFGASNPYALAGADWKLTLQPGQEVTFYGNDATPDIASDAKTIDLAGTLAQSLNVSVIMG